MTVKRVFARHDKIRKMSSIELVVSVPGGKQEFYHGGPLRGKILACDPMSREAAGAAVTPPSPALPSPAPQILRQFLGLPSDIGHRHFTERIFRPRPNPPCAPGRR
jgi:hypothetical protein